MIERPTHLPDEGPGEWPDAKWRELYPNIVEYLTQAAWSDGKKRELSTFSLKYQNGLVLAVLSDPATRRGLYVSGEGVIVAQKALEKALGDPGADWRAWGGGKRK